MTEEIKVKVVKDPRLAIERNRIYSNPVKTEYETNITKKANGKTYFKVIRANTYSNGNIKRRLVGVCNSESELKQLMKNLEKRS